MKEDKDFVPEVGTKYILYLFEHVTPAGNRELTRRPRPTFDVHPHKYHEGRSNMEKSLSRDEIHRLFR